MCVDDGVEPKMAKTSSGDYSVAGDIEVDDNVLH